MKKILLIILAGLVVLSICSCGKSAHEKSKEYWDNMKVYYNGKPIRTY